MGPSSIHLNIMRTPSDFTMLPWTRLAALITMCIHCMGTCRGSGRYFSLSLLYICEYRGILREVGIGNVYDPHPCYYTLYGCRDVLRVREVLVICMTLTTVIIHCIGVGTY